MAYVQQGYETKEIARKLGISPATVDQRINGARRKLGGGRRAEAARIFAAEQNIYERPIYPPSALPTETPITPSDGASGDNLVFSDAAFDDRASWDRGSLWHLPQIAPRDLGKAGRLLLVFALAFVILLVAGKVVDLLRGIGGWFPS